jgi:hypothetical protein
MMVRSLSAKTTLPAALAIAYWEDTRLLNVSERPRSIFLMEMILELPFPGSKYYFDT